MTKLFFILFPLLISHPVHVSMSGLYYDDDGEINLSLRMYSDDLGLDLYRLYDAEGEYNERDHIFVFKGEDSFYQRYADDHLQILFDGKPVKKELIKKEILDLETLLYFKLKSSDKSVEEVSISNSILTGLYPDQVNLFIFKVFKREEGVKFTVANTEKKFLLQESLQKIRK